MELHLEDAGVQEQANIWSHGNGHISARNQREGNGLGRGCAPQNGGCQLHHLADLVQHEALAHDADLQPVLPLHAQRAGCCLPSAAVHDSSRWHFALITWMWSTASQVRLCMKRLAAASLADTPAVKLWKLWVPL